MRRILAILCAASLGIHVLLAAPSARLAISPAGMTLVRQPYLQKVSATGATVVWASREPGAGEVRYRKNGASDVEVAPAATTLFTAAATGMAADYYQHEATVTGLIPSTTYSYDVFVGGIDATPASDQLTTAPPNGSGTVRFVVFGDSGSGSPNQRRLADLIAADSRANRWDFAVHVGDVAYPKSSYRFLHERFFFVYEEWLRRRPIFLAIGNHEDMASNGKPYLDLFALPENGASARYPDHRERYYSFDYGPVHFVALDTQLGLTGARRQEQVNWLAADLESTTQPWRIVFFHIPVYGSGDSVVASTTRAALQPVLERYGVQLVLAGHEHDYARGVPWHEGASSNSPVMHVVSGGGGATLNEPALGAWLAQRARAYHYLLVSVSDCTPSNTCELTLEAIGDDGVRFDAFTLPLRAQQQDSAAPTVDWMQPSEGAVLSGSAAVSALATDDEQITKVDLRVDGELRMVDDVAPFEWSWDTTRELNGVHDLELRAHDIAGRRTSSVRRSVRVSNAEPTVRLRSPLGGELVYTGLPYRIRWAAEAGDNPITGVRVYMASRGLDFQPIADCVGLPASARECVWSAPGPLTKKALVRVVAEDAGGLAAIDTSARFEVRGGTTSVALRFPDAPAVLGIGSTQSVYWGSALGLGATYQLDVSRDGGVSWNVLALSVLGLTNDLRWTVSAPPTTQGLIRVKALSVPLEDTSGAVFTIADPALAVTGPSAAVVWTQNTQAKVRWTTNLGMYDRVNLRLSTDGGASFPVVLAASVAASQRLATVTVPRVDTLHARILIESLDHPEWNAMSPDDFRIRPPQ